MFEVYLLVFVHHFPDLLLSMKMLLFHLIQLLILGLHLLLLPADLEQRLHLRTNKWEM